MGGLRIENLRLAGLLQFSNCLIEDKFNIFGINNETTQNWCVVLPEI